MSRDRVEIKDGARLMLTLEWMKVQQPHKISLFTTTKSSLVISKGEMFATESRDDLKNWLLDIWVQLILVWTAPVVTNEIKIKPLPSAWQSQPWP